jgi:NAD(P)-dependent dehydrogenase (short-subunit alcohol dehydrogenase family)
VNGTAERRPDAAFDVSGLVAIVTGAGSGIGRGTAVHLAAAGATVVCADIDQAAAGETAGQAGGGSYPVPVDVAKQASVQRLVDGVFARHGRVDAMCNIAGIITEAPLLELSERELDRIVAVNLTGAFRDWPGVARQRRGDDAVTAPVQQSPARHADDFLPCSRLSWPCVCYARPWWTLSHCSGHQRACEAL